MDHGREINQRFFHLDFDLIWAYKIIFGHVDIRPDDNFCAEVHKDNQKLILTSFLRVSAEHHLILIYY